MIKRICCLKIAKVMYVNGPLKKIFLLKVATLLASPLSRVLPFSIHTTPVTFPGTSSIKIRKKLKKTYDITNKQYKD